MAEITYEAHLVGNENELQNWSLQKLSSDPTPFTGQMWLNTTSGVLKYYDGTTIITLADLAAVEGLLDFKGGYNASTNTPDLDTAPSGVKKGDMYVVTASGNFYTEAVTAGDSLFAKVDNASSLTDWVIVERNLNPATETTEGIIQIATQAEVTTGTNDTKAVTPLKLAVELATLPVSLGKYAATLDSADANITRSFSGGVTTWVVTHGLSTSDTVSQIRRVSNDRLIRTEVENTSSATVSVRVNGNKSDGTFRIVIQG